MTWQEELKRMKELNVYWEEDLPSFIQKTREDAYREGLKENINNLEKTSEKYKTLFWCIREDAVREFKDSKAYKELEEKAWKYDQLSK
jgi:hypothetical protein